MYKYISIKYFIGIIFHIFGYFGEIYRRKKQFKLIIKFYYLFIIIVIGDYFEYYRNKKLDR